MFKLEDFKPVMDDLVVAIIEIKKNNIDTCISSASGSDYSCYVFDHDSSTTIMVKLADKSTPEMRYSFNKERKTYSLTVEKEALYRPELELMYLSELENVLVAANKKLKIETKKYNLHVEKMYQKLLKARELKEKLKTSCYIK